MATVSVIVCTYRRRALLPALAGALAAQTRLADEIVFVDNEASGETERLLAELGRGDGRLRGFRYVAEPALGISHARNRGIAAATGDLLVFLDDDALPVSGWLEAICVGADRYPGSPIFGGPIRLLLEADPPPWFPAEVMPYVHWLGNIDFGTGDMQMIAEGNNYRGPGGSNMAVRREAMAALGWFDTTLGHQGASLVSGEEVLFVERARARGYAVTYLGAAEVRHLVPPERVSLAWFVTRGLAEGRSQGRIMARVAEERRETAGLRPLLQGRAAAVAQLSERFAASRVAFADLPKKSQIDVAVLFGLIVELASVLGVSRAELGLAPPSTDDETLPDEWRAFVNGS